MNNHKGSKILAATVLAFLLAFSYMPLSFAEDTGGVANSLDSQKGTATENNTDKDDEQNPKANLDSAENQQKEDVSSKKREPKDKLRDVASLEKVTITLESKSQPSSTETSMPWGSSLVFRGNVFWSDGLQEVTYGNGVKWVLTDDTGNPTDVYLKTWIDEYDGIARAKIFAPYGMIAKLRLTATSELDTDLSAVQNIDVIDGSAVTGKRFYKPGAYSKDDVLNDEVWDSDKGTYTTQLQKMPAYYNKFLNRPKTEMSLASFRWAVTRILTKNFNKATWHNPLDIVTLSIDKRESAFITEYALFTPPVKIPPPPQPLPEMPHYFANDITVHQLGTDDNLEYIIEGDVVDAINGMCPLYINSKKLTSSQCSIALNEKKYTVVTLYASYLNSLPVGKYKIESSLFSLNHGKKYPSTFRIVDKKIVNKKPIDTPPSPQTGDGFNAALWIVVLVISFAGIGMTAFFRHRLHAE